VDKRVGGTSSTRAIPDPFTHYKALYKCPYYFTVHAFSDDDGYNTVCVCVCVCVWQCWVVPTVDIDDNQSTKCDSRSTGQLAANQLHDLVDLTIALQQVLLSTNRHVLTTTRNVDNNTQNVQSNSAKGRIADWSSLAAANGFVRS